MPTYSTAHRRPVALLLLSGVIACSDGDSGTPLVVQRDSAGVQIVEAMRPLWGDSSLWSIDPEPVVDLTLTGSGPEHEFYRVGSMKQRPDGSLMLANRSSEEVRVFSAAGEFLGSFGGSGDGPGEFRSLQRIENAGDTLLALGDGRVTVAAPDLTVVRTFAIPPFTIDFYYLDTGAILLEPRSLVLPPAGGGAGQIRPPVPLVVFDLEGERIDSIGEMQGPELYLHTREGFSGYVPIYFGKTSHVTTFGQRILLGSNDMMQLEELDMSGNLLRILRIPDYPLDLSAAQIAAERDFVLGRGRPGSTSPLRQALEKAPASDTRPAFTDILVDPSGAVWLELHRGESEQDLPKEWLVLDADGTWLGTVAIPDRFTVSDITMDAVLGVWEDELDVEHPQCCG